MYKKQRKKVPKTPASFYEIPKLEKPLKESLETHCEKYFIKLQPDKKRIEEFNDFIGKFDRILHENSELKSVDNFAVKYFGSVRNGFWANSSDIDLTIIFDNYLKMKEEPLKILEIIEKIIIESKIGKINILISKARVPILKFRDLQYNFECDLSINSILPPINSDLILAYTKYDERFVKLGYLIKEWAKNNNILGGDKRFLTSYAWILLIIHYLQIIKPPILPNLQKSGDYKTSQKFIEYQIKSYENEEIEIPPPFYENVKANCYFLSDTAKISELKLSHATQNTQSISELLCGFFQYYAYDFKLKEHMVSIKEGRVLPKPKTHRNMLISIQDPFDDFYNPGDILHKNTKNAEIMMKKLQEAYINCCNGTFYF